MNIRHFVYVSIDGIRYPYNKTKVATEAEMRKDFVPWSILRATQFHDLIALLLRGFARLPGLMAVPTGGPEIRDMNSLARSWLSARKDERRMTDLRLPFKFSRRIAEGGLTSPEHKDGRVTFEQHLAEKYALS